MRRGRLRFRVRLPSDPPKTGEKLGKKRTVLPSNSSSHQPGIANAITALSLNLTRGFYKLSIEAGSQCPPQMATQSMANFVLIFYINLISFFRVNVVVSTLFLAFYRGLTNFRITSLVIHKSRRAVFALTHEVCQ